MRKPLYLFICTVILLTIAAGCSNLNGAGVENAGTDAVGSDKSISENVMGSSGSEGSPKNEDVSDNNTGSEGQTGAADKAATNPEPSAFENINDFDGVSMAVKDGTASAVGLTVVFENKTDSECIYGEYFVLERKTGGSWFQVPVTFDGEYVFNSIGYILNPQGKSERTLEWELLYGGLEPGEYRIIKDILDFRETGDYDKYFLAAEFVL